MSVRKAGSASLTKFRGDMTHYESVVMADAPAMFWPLQVDKRDISGNNRPVNGLAGTIQWNEEQSLQPNDPAAKSWYSAGSGVISRADEAWMDTNTITVECLLRKTDGTSYAFAVSRDDNGASSNRMWMLRFYNDGTIQVIAWNTSGTLYSVNGSTIVGNMNTVHVAFTWSDAYLSLYLNGEDEGTRAISGTLRTGNRAIEVFQGAGWYPLTGYISHVAVFTSALTETRINAHATAAGL